MGEGSRTSATADVGGSEDIEKIDRTRRRRESRGGARQRQGLWILLLGALLSPPVLTLGSSPLFGQGPGPFAAPISISGDFTDCADPTIAHSGGVERVAVAFTSGGEVIATDSLSSFTAAQDVSASPLSASVTPAVAPGALLDIQLAYAEEDPGGGDLEIALVDNSGGVFSGALLLTENDVDDSDPAVDVGATGFLAVAWQRAGEVFLSIDAGTEVLVGEGSSPRVLARADGSVEVIYLRAGQLFRRVHELGVQGPEVPVGGFPAGVDAFDVALDPADTLYIAARIAGEISLFAEGATGPVVAVPTPGLVDGGFALAAGDEIVALAAEIAGQIHAGSDGGGGWTFVAAAVSGTAPDLAVDAHGYLHVVGIDAGQVIYTTDAPPVSAAFSVGPASGTLPLEVTFTNASSGLITAVLWDFGDGNTSSEPSPAHTYLAPGPFDVTLTVWGPASSDGAEQLDAVSGELPAELFGMPTLHAAPGGEIWHPVIASHGDPIQGFQFAATYDEGAVTFLGVDFAGSITSAVDAEFTFVDSTPQGSASELVVAVVIDFLAPFDGRTIDAGSEQPFFLVHYLVEPGAGDVVTWTVTDGLGDPPVDTVFAAASGVSIHPYLMPGLLILDGTGESTFVRGDANSDGNVDIGDAIFLLDHLFSFGPAPVCPDAADANDDGALDVGDPIRLLDMLFSGGLGLPYPFPGIGLDPTADALGACAP